MQIGLCLACARRNLKLDYLDLYLIHLPISLKPIGPDFPFEKEDLVHMDVKSLWEVMEKCQELGLAKSIGVSNFSCKKLEFLLATAKIPPAVNQVSSLIRFFIHLFVGLVI